MEERASTRVEGTHNVEEWNKRRSTRALEKLDLEQLCKFAQECERATFSKRWRRRLNQTQITFQKLTDRFVAIGGKASVAQLPLSPGRKNGVYINFSALPHGKELADPGYLSIGFFAEHELVRVQRSDNSAQWLSLSDFETRNVEQMALRELEQAIASQYGLNKR